MSSQNSEAAEPYESQSLLLHSLLASEFDESNVDGQKLRLSTFVTEVTEVTPSKLADVLAARIQQTLTKTIDRLGQVYINKVRDRVPSEPEVLRIRDTAEGKFYEFAVALRELFTHVIVEIENFMTQFSFSVELELYTGGFLRFQHNEGIDYTDPKSAQNIETQLTETETKLEASLRELVILRSREKYLATVAHQAEQLDLWLERAVAGGELVNKAQQVRELVKVVTEGMDALRQVVGDSL